MANACESLTLEARARQGLRLIQPRHFLVHRTTALTFVVPAPLELCCLLSSLLGTPRAHPSHPKAYPCLCATMPSVLVPLANGSEELEAVSLVNVLRRCGVDVTLASVEADTLGGAPVIKGSRGTRVVCDVTLAAAERGSWDAIALAGGLPGALRRPSPSVGPSPVWCGAASAWGWRVWPLFLLWMGPWC